MEHPFIEGTQSLNTTSEKFAMRSRFTDGVACFGIAFFGFCAFMAYRDGQFEAIPLFLVFIPIGIYLLLINGILEIDERHVVFTNAFGKYRLEWDEIAKAMMDEKQGSIVLFSNNNENILSLPGPSIWGGPCREQMWDFFDARLEKRGVTIEQSQKALLVFSKNTRQIR